MMTSEGSQQITSCLIPELNGHIPRTTGKNVIDVECNRIYRTTMTGQTNNKQNLIWHVF